MPAKETSLPPAAKPRFFYGYVIVGAIFLTMALTHGVRYSFGVFFKPMVTEFGWTRAMTSGAFSLSWIMEGLLSIFFGAFNDRFGPRIMMTILGFLAGLSYILMSQTSSIWHLYIFYGLIGGAGNSIFTPLTSTIARWFAQRRSMMTGIAIAGIGFGSLIGPLLASSLISAFTWRAAYFILGATVLVIVILAAQFLRRDPSQKGQVPYGEEMAGEKIVRPFTRGFTLKEALRTRQFWLFFGMMFCLAFAFFAIQVHIAPYATDLGIPAATGAAILGTIGGASIIGRGVLGSIGDRIGNKRAFIIGFIFMTVALLWLIPARESWKLYSFAAAFGLGYGISSTQESPLAAALFGLTSHGLIFGTAGIGFTLGAALGPFMAGYIFDVSGNYHAAFLVSATVGVIGFVLNALLPLRPPKPA